MILIFISKNVVSTSKKNETNIGLVIVEIFGILYIYALYAI